MAGNNLFDRRIFVCSCMFINKEKLTAINCGETVIVTVSHLTLGTGIIVTVEDEPSFKLSNCIHR